MRKILFRGIDVYSEKWVYGHFCIDKKGRHIITDNHSSIVTYYYEIIPTTLGEYIGRADINGKDVFEGDICYIDWLDVSGASYRTVVICYGDCGFSFDGTHFGEDDVVGRIDSGDYLEVIGNYYENHNLLEVEEE